MIHKKDAMGNAIADYWKRGKAAKLRVLSPMFDEDEIPVETLFRNYDEMPLTEKMALQRTKGHILDVGAGAGCHSLALQEMEKKVTAIDISPLSVETMKARGVKEVIEGDVFEVEGKYDTILMLMNGIGIVGTIDRLKDFFKLLDRILAPEGEVICDSSDIKYIFEDEEGNFDAPYPNRYYGELEYQMKYKNIKGDSFCWLYIDAMTLIKQAERYGYHAEIIHKGEHYDYLARIWKSEE